MKKEVEKMIIEELVFIGFSVMAFGFWICEMSIVRSIPALEWYYNVITNPVSIGLNLIAVICIGFLGEKFVKTKLK